VRKGKITTVKYRNNAEVAPFKHVHIEVERTVGVGEAPDAALQDAAFFVNRKLTTAVGGTLTEDPLLSPTDRTFSPSARHKLTSYQNYLLKAAFFEAFFPTPDRSIIVRRWERFQSELANRRLL
jgi:hypothetical protein